MRTMQDAVLRKQIDLLYSQSRVAVLTAAGVALFVGIYFWLVADRVLLSSWLGMILLLSLARGVLMHRFNRVRYRQFDPLPWLRRHVVLTFVSGLAWGLLSLLYDPAWPMPHQVVLFVVIAGIGSP